MSNLPYCLYSESLPAGSLRRIAIALLMFILCAVTIALYGYFYSEKPYSAWGLVVIPVIFFMLARRWIGLKRPQGLIIFRFDRKCDFMSLETESGITHFRSYDVDAIKNDNGLVYFTVRGQPHHFPAKVYSAGNFLTGLAFNGLGRNHYFELSQNEGRLRVSGARF